MFAIYSPVTLLLQIGVTVCNSEDIRLSIRRLGTQPLYHPKPGCSAGYAGIPFISLLDIFQRRHSGSKVGGVVSEHKHVVNARKNFAIDVHSGVAAPVEEVPYPRAPRRLPIILTREEAVRMIDSASNLFHRAMLITLYSTGMRRAELCNLKVEDIDSTRMIIHIRQGNPDRGLACRR